jgi:hypothetical protein
MARIPTCITPIVAHITMPPHSTLCAWKITEKLTASVPARAIPAQPSRRLTPVGDRRWAAAAALVKRSGLVVGIASILDPPQRFVNYSTL